MMRFLCALVCVFVCQTSAFAMSPKVNRCSVMATAARKIVELRTLQSEKDALGGIRQNGLPPNLVDVLDGLVALVYTGGMSASPDKVALTMYATCAMQN
jgi:hypothetical protein